MSTRKPRVVGVVHARGGSRRIPLKNLKLLNGTPLVAYIIKAALRAKCLDRLLVSTDHPDIARISREFGAEVPFTRPTEISEDVPSELVTQHAIEFVEKQDGRPVDIAVTFQPTTPFCRPEDINACIDELIRSGADSVITVNPIHERPEWMFTLDAQGWAGTLMGTALQGETGVSQSLPGLYIPNGGVYATRRDVLFGQNVLIGKKTRVVVMPRERSVDIDDPIDFTVAEAVGRMLGAG